MQGILFLERNFVMNATVDWASATAVALRPSRIATCPAQGIRQSFAEVPIVSMLANIVF